MMDLIEKLSDPDVLVGIQKALQAGVCGPVAILYGWFWWRSRNSKKPGIQMVRDMALGIAMFMAGFAAQRSYWWGWRMNRSTDNELAAHWFVDNAEWLVIFTALILMGGLIHLKRRFQIIFGYLWWVPTVLWCAFLVAVTLSFY